MKRKPKIGETLYALNIGNAARRVPQVLKPVVVTSVGRKYFTVGEGFSARQFHIDNWVEKTDYNATVAIYESEQAWHDEREEIALTCRICRAFEYNGNRLRLPLSALREIGRILDMHSEA